MTANARMYRRKADRVVRRAPREQPAQRGAVARFDRDLQVQLVAALRVVADRFLGEHCRRERAPAARAGRTAKWKPSSSENANDAGQRSARVRSGRSCHNPRASASSGRAACNEHAVAVHERLRRAEKQPAVAGLEDRVELFERPFGKRLGRPRQDRERAGSRSSRRGSGRRSRTGRRDGGRVRGRGRGSGSRARRSSPAGPPTRTTATCFFPNGQAKCASGQAHPPAGGRTGRRSARPPAHRTRPVRATTRTPRASASDDRLLNAQVGRHARNSRTVRDAMLGRRGEDRLAQGDRLDVVAAGDLRLGAVLDRDQQLRHRADEGVREPHVVPARAEPAVPGLLARAEFERARLARRVLRPADRPLHQPVGPLDPPADADVARDASRLHGPAQTSSHDEARAPRSYSRM